LSRNGEARKGFAVFYCDVTVATFADNSALSIDACLPLRRSGQQLLWYMSPPIGPLDALNPFS
jgi:hypothetical protein